MKFGVFGTGSVGRTIASKLAELGHAVCVGTRDPAQTVARDGSAPFREWLEKHPKVELATLPQAATHGEVLVNATSGVASIDALTAAGEANLSGKVLIDISNPLDFSKGMPPSLTVSNTDSLAEQIQRAFPGARVVKTLNIVNASLMVAPKELAGGAHTMFVCGNDAAAKATTAELLRSFGWEDIVDLGGLDNARGMEMLLPIWVRLYGVLKTPKFAFKLVR